MGPPGWLVGTALAIAVLLAGLFSPLFAVGIVGFLLVPGLAMWAGAAAASAIDSRRSNTTIVVTTTIVVFALLVGVQQFRVSSAPQAGPSVYPPEGQPSAGGNAR